MAFDSCRKLHQPGEQVPITGIYKVLHQAHRQAHDVVLRELDTFPPCQHCGAEVRFELIHSVDESQI
jgi:hypothetical protein